jgi:hypothetical protein
MSGPELQLASNQIFDNLQNELGKFGSEVKRAKLLIEDVILNPRPELE